MGRCIPLPQGAYDAYPDFLHFPEDFEPVRMRGQNISLGISLS